MVLFSQLETNTVTLNLLNFPLPLFSETTCGRARDRESPQIVVPVLVLLSASLKLQSIGIFRRLLARSDQGVLCVPFGTVLLFCF